MKYYSPKDEIELLEVLDSYQNYYILNGGSDLIVQKNEQALNDYPFIDISKIANLNYIKEDNDNVYIGAAIKYNQILDSKIIQDNFKGLIMVADEIGSTQIRNIGTVAGNIANASPGGDSPVILENLDARVILKSNNGTREMKMDDFIVGFRESSLLEKEYISGIVIPKNKKYSFFKKYGLGHKEKVIISNASIALSFNINNDKLCNVKVTLGACSTKFKNNDVLAGYLENKNLNNINLNEWLELVDDELKQLTNTYFYDMKKGHLKGCAHDAFKYLVNKLEVE